MPWDLGDPEKLPQGGESRGFGGPVRAMGVAPSLPTPVPAFVGAFSPLPVLPRDLPARQELSMETQMPVSRARSTMEAKSLLRWGTREAAGTKQRGGQVRSLLCFWPRSGTQKEETCPRSPSGSAIQCPAQPRWCSIVFGGPGHGPACLPSLWWGWKSHFLAACYQKLNTEA